MKANDKKREVAKKISKTVNVKKMDGSVRPFWIGRGGLRKET